MAIPRVFIKVKHLQLWALCAANRCCFDLGGFRRTVTLSDDGDEWWPRMGNGGLPYRFSCRERWACRERLDVFGVCACLGTILVR